MFPTCVGAPIAMDALNLKRFKNLSSKVVFDNSDAMDKLLLHYHCLETYRGIALDGDNWCKVITATERHSKEKNTLTEVRHNINSNKRLDKSLFCFWCVRVTLPGCTLTVHGRIIIILAGMAVV